jgi:hypothetical protein
LINYVRRKSLICSRNKRGRAIADSASYQVAVLSFLLI